MRTRPVYIFFQKKSGQKANLKRLYIRQRISRQCPQTATVNANPEHDARKDKSQGTLPAWPGKCILGFEYVPTN